ncbi:MAG: hypothetical protein ACTSYD_02065 [Candidatus Heimdallarchaeaceae archaeon]
MGLLSEAIFLVLTMNIFNIAYDITFIVSFFMVGGYFMVYRFFMDWNYFGQDENGNYKRGAFWYEVCKELRHPVIRKSAAFPAAMGFLMMTANFQFYGLMTAGQLWAWCCVSTLAAWWVIDFVRYLHSKVVHTYEVKKIPEVRSEWTS